MSLGDRLHVVALVCGVAALLVLAGGLALAMGGDLESGAAPTERQQRLLRLTRPAGLELGLVVLVGGAAVAVGRWLDDDGGAAAGAVPRLVAGTAAAVGALAVLGMYGEVAWRLPGAEWSWYATSIAGHTATAGLAAAGCWLAAPGRWRSRGRG